MRGERRIFAESAESVESAERRRFSAIFRRRFILQKKRAKARFFFVIARGIITYLRERFFGEDHDEKSYLSPVCVSTSR